MSPPLQQIQTSPTLPAAADVVVIGGGIIGVFAAYYLARRGVSVALVEKGRIGAEQSSRNWGWCRQQNRDARELPMASKSLELWQRFAIETGEDTGFHRCGLLYLSNDDAELSRWASWGDFAKTAGVTTYMLDSRQATERGRLTGRTWKGGVFSPTDGTADPGKAAPAVAAALIKLGGSVIQACAARGVELEGGRVSGVVTEAGVIKTRTVVLAGGAWASSFCRQLGIRFPQASIRQSILSVSPVEHRLPDALFTSGVSITRRNDGRYALAISGRARVDVTGQFLRFAPQFLPMALAFRWGRDAEQCIRGARRRLIDSTAPGHGVEGSLRGFQEHTLTNGQALARGRQGHHRCRFEVPCRQNALQFPLRDQPRAIPFGSRDNAEAVDGPVPDDGAVVRRQRAAQADRHALADAFACSIVLSKTQTRHVFIVFSQGQVRVPGQFGGMLEL